MSVRDETVRPKGCIPGALLGAAPGGFATAGLAGMAATGAPTVPVLGGPSKAFAMVMRSPCCVRQLGCQFWPVVVQVLLRCAFHPLPTGAQAWPAAFRLSVRLTSLLDLLDRSTGARWGCRTALSFVASFGAVSSKEWACAFHPFHLGFYPACCCPQRPSPKRPTKRYASDGRTRGRMT